MPIAKKTVTPYWQSDCGRAVVYVGDCCEVMPCLDRDQFHAVVTDPPYGLEFMGREWDAPWKKCGTIEVCDEGTDKSHPFRDGTNRIAYGLSNPQGYQAWFLLCAEEMLRVVKLGAHLLSFGGTRMWHRAACAIEDAGFEIRDTIMWLYGSGFPKSRDVSKAIDKMYGVDRENVDRPGGCSNRQGDGTIYGLGHSGRLTSDEPVTEEAKQWDGWGTALKPAWEPILVARKPFADTVESNVVEHGCGGINVDGCRVGVEGGCAHQPGTGGFDAGTVSAESGHLNSCRSPQQDGLGRWPANTVLSHTEDCRQVGTRRVKTGTAVRHRSGGKTFGTENDKPPLGDMGYADADGMETVAAWICPESCPVRLLDEASGESRSKQSFRGNGIGSGYGGSTAEYDTERGYGDSGGASRFFYTSKANDSDRSVMVSTSHPTTKPLDLMRYLVRLVCARGGTVFDPFMGSGSTGCAAILEGMHFVGIDQSKEYVDMAVDRLKEVLGVHPVVKRLASGKRVIKDTPPPPKRMR